MESKIIGMNIAVAFVDGAVLLSPLAAIVDVNENPAAVELDPDYAAGKAIEAKQWSAAIAATHATPISRTTSVTPTATPASSMLLSGIMSARSRSVRVTAARMNMSARRT
jgi:hypothetical protein